MKNERLIVEQEWNEVFKTELPKHIHKAYAIKYIKWQRENKVFSKKFENYINKLLQNYEKGISTFTPSSLNKIEIKTMFMKVYIFQ